MVILSEVVLGIRLIGCCVVLVCEAKSCETGGGCDCNSGWTVILVSSTRQELLSCCAVATCFPLLQLVVLGFAFSVVFVVPFVRGTAAHVETFAVCLLWQEAMGQSNLRRLVFEGGSLVE